MRRSRTTRNEQHFDALTMSGNLTILGGSTRQMFYVAGQTYEDDRRWVPCILGGSVYVNDPAGAMSGETALTGIEWYTQVPDENDASQGRITNPDASVLANEEAWRTVDFLISDGSDADWCEDVPEGCLIVHKNVAALASMTIYGVLKFLDTRTGRTVRYLCSKEFTTEVYNNEQVVMKGDSGDTLLLDPMAFSDTVPEGKTLIDVPWMRTLNAALVGSEGNLPDSEACYQWLVADSTSATGFREFTEDEIEAMNISGMRTGRLSLDVRLLTGDTRLRCYGKRRFEGDAWSNPATGDNPFYECTVVLTMNQNFNFVPTIRRGADPGVGMNKVCEYEMSLYYNNRPVPDEKKCLFTVKWKAENLRNGTVSVLGWGQIIEFIPSDFSLPYPEGMNVFGEVYTYAGCKVVVQDGKWLVQDGALMIAPTYE